MYCAGAPIDLVQNAVTSDVCRKTYPWGRISDSCTRSCGAARPGTTAGKNRGYQEKIGIDLGQSDAPERADVPRQISSLQCSKTGMADTRLHGGAVYLMNVGE